MASANGKQNPFGNGKSGAVGNSGGGSTPGMSNHRGPDRSQKMGESIAGQFDGDHPKEGDKHLKVDPPASRVKPGFVQQCADDKGGLKSGGPWKNLGGKGPSMPSENSDIDDGGPAGDVRNEPTADSEY